MQDTSKITELLQESGSCCDALSSVLPGKVFTKGESEYETYLRSFWLANASDVLPRCVVVPSDTADVSTAVAILGAAFTMGMKDCKFAIRSGAHASHASRSNIQDGVVIWLRKLNDIGISEDRSFVSVGPGATHGELYAKLDPLELTTVSGRDSAVGLGGLTLGGGFSFLSPQYGYSCDHVLRFEVVLSSGAVVDVDSQSHTGLFCALKGGTNNFGIVTRLDLNVVPQGKLWGGSIITDIANRPAIFEFLEKFVQEEAFDRRASIFADTAWTSGRGYFMITYPVYTKPIENPPFFAPLLDLPKPIEKTTRIDTMKGFTDQLTTFNPPGRRCDQGSFTSAPSAAFMESYFQMFSKAVESVKDIPGLVMVSIFQPQSRQIVAQSKARGPNSLGLDETDGDLVNVFSFASYNDARYDERVHEAIKRLISNGEKEAARMGVLKDFIYMNYAGPWQDVIGSYGKANVDAMKKVSKAYDPIQLFQHAVPSAFKLPKTEGHGGADSRL